MAYGADATLSGFAVSTDAGATFTLIGETDYTANGSFYNNYDLTGYAGQTIHIALVYNATFGNSWGVNTMEIRAKEDPIIPVFAHSKLVFPVTKIGESFRNFVSRYLEMVGRRWTRFR